LKWRILEKHSININIFGRQFPARVDSEEAEVIREAAQLIHNKMRAFKSEYKTQDDVDIAIMCCLSIMTEYLTYKQRDNREADLVQQEISVLDEKIERTLQKLQQA